MTQHFRSARLFAIAMATLIAAPTWAQDGDPVMAAPAEAGSDTSSNNAQDLAKQLSNPVASLISFPLQQNIDGGYGPDGDGLRLTTNIQPVVPISIGEKWNMISRTILPVIYQEGVTAQSASESGLGDVTQSLFFSPKEVGPSGIIWGVGPAFLVPTATNDALGSEKWGAGPTAVVLKQSGHVTVGMLANHIWSFAGSDNRSDISSTFVQPFLSYTTPKATTYTLNSETSYNWIADQWLVPVIVQMSQLTHIGKQPIQVGTGLKYYVVSPDGGPDWGIRFNLTFLFPKK